jgi:hypothetical protein
MTDSMIERVREALRDCTDWTDDGRLTVEEAEAALNAAARIAIESMREPTERMVEVGRYGVDTPSDRPIGHEDAREVWRGMIDEALAEPPQPAKEGA